MGNVLWTVPLRIVVGILWISAGSSVSGTIGMIATVVGWLIAFGLLTSIAGFVAFVLGLVLIFAGSATTSMVLLTFASLAVMNGSGRTFGLDYWVTPFLEKMLGRSLYGKHESRYNDLKK